MLEALVAGIERELPRAVALRHRLHAHPELAHAERGTAAAVAAELPVAARSVAGTGLLATVGPSLADRPSPSERPSPTERPSSTDGPSPTTRPVAVRAELDALPIRERTGARFASRGEAMHACGHDVHMAALVALTRSAQALGEELPAPLLAVFQPSEEAYPSGAQMLAQGGLGSPTPAAIVAAHVHPEQGWGTVALDGGTINASCDYVEMVVRGESSHGAYPHRGRDAILALAQVIVALHAQVGRRFDPLHPVVLTVGTVSGGEAENVLPAAARAGAALRAHRPEDRRALRALVEEVVGGVAAAHGCSGEVQLTPGEPALENDAAIVAWAHEMLPAADLARAPEWRSYGSDDMAFLGAVAPLAMGFVGLAGAPGFAVRPLHHPELLPPDEAVAAVARAQAVLYVAAASAYGAPAMAAA
ncbi:MAG TPA: amidohydrolase [Solirubrobacteraceae bacterium]|nr:amidohydrolase [Solirubrobacteraceae bacterium]